MKVICELAVFNDEDASVKVISIEGTPDKRTIFVNICINEDCYQVRASDLIEAVSRTRGMK